MNDFDLDAKLKNIPLPERPEDYWDNFPAQVRQNLRRARVESAPGSIWLPRVAWAGGLALIVAAGFFCSQFQPLKITSAALSKHEMILRLKFAEFKTGLRVFMLDEHGMHYLIAEKE